MKYPSLYTMRGLREALNSPSTQVRTDDGWVPARPMGYPSLRTRLKLAWLVFTGRADAFTWPGGQ